MAARRLVLDANILIRAVLGKRVKNVLTTYAVEAEFFVPELAYDDAERQLPKILTKHDRAHEIDPALTYLTQLRETVLPVPEEIYLDQKAEALARIEQRDPDDGLLPAALALLLHPHEHPVLSSLTLEWTRRLDWACVKIEGLPRVTLKGLRHTHATLLPELGEPPKVVQERLGHSTITTTMNIYSHVTPTMQRSAIDRFAAHLGETPAGS